MRSITTLVLLLLAGCASGSSQQPDGGNPAETLRQIQALVGTPSCTESSQCSTLPVGARACGGPERYLPWSSAQTDRARLEELAGRYKAERQAQIKERGEVSDCRFLVDPGAVCRAGSCQLAPLMSEVR